MKTVYSYFFVDAIWVFKGWDYSNPSTVLYLPQIVAVIHQVFPNYYCGFGYCVCCCGCIVVRQVPCSDDLGCIKV